MYFKIWNPITTDENGAEFIGRCGERFSMQHAAFEYAKDCYDEEPFDAVDYLVRANEPSSPTYRVHVHVSLNPSFEVGEPQLVA